MLEECGTVIFQRRSTLFERLLCKFAFSHFYLLKYALSCLSTNIERFVRTVMTAGAEARVTFPTENDTLNTIADLYQLATDRKSLRKQLD